MTYRIGALWAIAGLCWSTPLVGEVLIHEHFEDSTSAAAVTGVKFVEDVVGCGGLSEPNRYSAALDGEATSCADFGPDKQVSSPQFTVEAFIKAATRDDYAAIAADWDEEGDERSWALVMTPRGGLRFDVSPDGKFHGGNRLETAARLIEPGKWYHVAAVSDGNASRIFINGRLKAEGVRAVPGVFPNNRAHLKVGNVDRYATDGPRPWKGCLDEVRITLRALGPSELIRTRDPMPEVRGPVPAAFEMPFVAQDRAAAERWQQQARARLFELVERQQPRRSTDELPLDFQVGEATEQDGYTLYAASYQSNDEKMRIRCLLAVPSGDGPFPAMLAMHGHGGRSEVVFDRTLVYHGMADRFARGGYVVLAPSFPHRDYCATMLWDLLRAVDVLESHPKVDGQRLGVAGLSMGGEWTMWSAACDPRLKSAVVSGWMCTTEGVFAVPNCECWELPGFVELMDVCEVHLLIAPRPLLFESADQDPCFPIRYTREGFARVQAGYRVFGAEENVQQDVWPSGHEWHGVMAYPMIDQALGGRSSEVRDLTTN